MSYVNTKGYFHLNKRVLLTAVIIRAALLRDCSKIHATLAQVLML